MKTQIHEHQNGMKHTVSKTRLTRQQEKRDRMGALIVFAIFFGTFIYVLIEHYFN